MKFLIIIILVIIASLGVIGYIAYNNFTECEYTLSYDGEGLDLVKGNCVEKKYRKCPIECLVYDQQSKKIIGLDDCPSEKDRCIK